MKNEIKNKLIVKRNELKVRIDFKQSAVTIKKSNNTNMY